MAIIGRFAVNISYNIGLQYAAELLPTVVRGQGVALVHIMGYVASILAPFIVYLVSFNSTIILYNSVIIFPTKIRWVYIFKCCSRKFIWKITLKYVLLQANISTDLPLLILGILGIVGGVLTLFLPETLDEDLPQTLQDGEQFGVHQKFFYFPCIRK